MPVFWLIRSWFSGSVHYSSQNDPTHVDPKYVDKRVVELLEMVKINLTFTCHKIVAEPDIP